MGPLQMVENNWGSWIEKTLLIGAPQKSITPFITIVGVDLAGNSSSFFGYIPHFIWDREICVMLVILLGNFGYITLYLGTSHFI